MKLFVEYEWEFLLVASLTLNLILLISGCVVWYLRCKYKDLSDLDAYTGVLNRVSIERKVDDILEHGNCNGKYALLVLDIDNFKRLNDLFGHPFGDQVIEDVANVMKKQKRMDALIGRLGGDEFAIFIKNFNNVDEVKEYAEAINKALHLTYQQAQDEFILTVSIGIAFHSNNMRFNELFRLADETLYKAKYSGRDCVAL